jgi:hypothetical protein
MLLRILIITALALMVYFGIRRIWRDWSQKYDGTFRPQDKKDSKRD